MVFFTLSNELGKCLPILMTSFCKECNICNKMLDSFYHMKIKVPITLHFYFERVCTMLL